MRRGTAALLVGIVLAVLASAAAARVLRVGTYHGIKGQYSSIQAAINAAKPGDWILIGPGDYKLTHTYKTKGGHGDDRAGAAVLITKPGLWIRGMNRNKVWIDGTKKGSPLCSRKAKDQVYGPIDSNGKPSGRNGILVFRARNVIVENLSACNFLNGDMGAGNEIWWDGGQSTGTQMSLGNWWGSYLTATSTFFKDQSAPSAGYGIYSSNTKGPGNGEFAYDFASNMNDSAFYVGACPDCHVTLNHVRGENAPQGYSGTNSGGHVLVENSEWDHNETGFATGDLNNDDAPSPQNGTCPTEHGTRMCPRGFSGPTCAGCSSTTTSTTTTTRTSRARESRVPRRSAPASRSMAAATTCSSTTGSCTTAPGGSCSCRSPIPSSPRRRRTARAASILARRARVRRCATSMTGAASSPATRSRTTATSATPPTVTSPNCHRWEGRLGRTTTRTATASTATWIRSTR